MNRRFHLAIVGIAILCPQLAIAAFGSWTSSFASGIDAVHRAYVHQPDDKQVWCQVYNSGGIDYRRLSRFTSSGSADSTFGVSGNQNHDVGQGAGLSTCKNLVRLSDGRFLAVGQTKWPGNSNVTTSTVTRYTANGQVDTFSGIGNQDYIETRFSGSYTTSDQTYGEAIAVQPDGKKARNPRSGET